MLYDHRTAAAVLVDCAEPLLNSVEQGYVAAESAEVLLAQGDLVRLGLVVHQFHIGQHVGCVLPYGDVVGHPPELLGGLAHCLNEPELLHIARRQSAVKVVNKGYYRFLPHNVVCLLSLRFATNENLLPQS